ncbi:hypothetical protein SHIRM173S_02637 [Streptomyces hirsutus]
MAVMTDALVPALEDAREAHEALVDRLRADATVTPAGPYRQMLEREVDDVQDSLQRIEDHVRDLRPPSGLVGDRVDIARLISRSAVRTAMLPLTIGSTLVTDMLRGRRPTDERRLLRNAEDEYAVTARALAACRAGQEHRRRGPRPGHRRSARRTAPPGRGTARNTGGQRRPERPGRGGRGQRLRPGRTAAAGPARPPARTAVRGARRHRAPAPAPMEAGETVHGSAAGRRRRWWPRRD